MSSEQADKPQAMPRQLTKPRLNRTQTSIYHDQLIEAVKEATIIQANKKTKNVAQKLSEEAYAIQEFKTELDRHRIESHQSTESKQSTKLELGQREESVEEEDNNSSDNDSPPNSSDEYDTDLECEERQSTPYDRYGLRTYLHSCRKMLLKPIGAVRKGLQERHLVMRGRGLHKYDTLAICNALLDNGSVTTLCLDDNLMGPDGAHYIALMLRENDNITSLSLANNNICGSGLESISNMMLANDSITRLDLTGSNFGDEDISNIIKMMDLNTNLTYLNLSHNHFGDIAGEVLGPAISDNEHIKYLDLSWNKIRTPGGMAIAEGIEDNVCLQVLNLAYNGLSGQGAFSMAVALEMNDVLTDLDLTCNRIFDDAVMRMAQMLDRNEVLRRLRLTNNPITTAGAVSILKVLEKNEDSALDLLDLSSVPIYRQALDTVVEIRDLRPSFRFQYGGVIESNNAVGGNDDNFNNRNPMTILKEYIATKNMRLVDLFKMLDKDGGGSISRDEFINGLRSIDVPMTNNQLERLIKMLDKDGDGEVDYAELVSGDKEHRRKMRIQMEAAKKAAKLAKQKKKEKQAAEKAKAEETARLFLEGLLHKEERQKAKKAATAAAEKLLNS